jgi:hypothetical protein
VPDQPDVRTPAKELLDDPGGDQLIAERVGFRK